MGSRHGESLSRSLPAGRAKLCRPTFGTIRRPIDAVAQIGSPILYVHGKADRLIPPEHVERLSAATVAPHEVLSVPEMDHVRPSRFLGDPFMERVLAFLDENGLAPALPPAERERVLPIKGRMVPGQPSMRRFPSRSVETQVCGSLPVHSTATNHHS